MLNIKPNSVANPALRERRLLAAAHNLHEQVVVRTQLHPELSAVLLAVTGVDIRLAMDANPAKGEDIHVVLTCPETGECSSLEAVVHWKEMRGAEHEIGAFLKSPLPGNLRDLCRDPRRSAERYRCRISGRLSWGSTRPDVAATAVNYSYDGVAFHCPTEACVDDIFQFCWHDGNHNQHINGLALWQIEQSSGFMIGCQTEPGAGRILAGLVR